MRKMLKKITSLLLVAVMVCGIFSAVPVSAASIKYDKNVTIYLSGVYSDGSYIERYESVTVKNISAKLKNVKSSNKKCVEINNVTYNKKKNNETIALHAKKPGTAKITFKDNGKSYTINVTVKKYTNPLQTLTITGVNNNKNVASSFAKLYCPDLQLKKNVSNAKLVVKPKSGWKLTDVQFESTLNKTPNTTKKKTYSLGKLKKNGEYYIHLGFKNKKDKGIIDLYFWIM